MSGSSKKRLIITIDGPSGAGKSTIAKMLASALGYTYIDTGAMYRGIAFAFGKGGHKTTPEKFLEGLSIQFDFKGETKVFLDGEDISDKIRTPEISMLASELSQKGVVRQYLTRIQRQIGKDGGIVLEGRDTGSVVFPDADIKFYLDADPRERARRRHLEFSAKGIDSDLGAVEKDMSQRDRNDSERGIAPLVIPPGGQYIDTTDISIEGVIHILMEKVREKG